DAGGRGHEGGAGGRVVVEVVVGGADARDQGGELRMAADVLDPLALRIDPPAVLQRGDVGFPVHAALPFGGISAQAAPWGHGKICQFRQPMRLEGQGRRGSTRIFARCGSANSSKAAATSERPTCRLISGATSMRPSAMSERVWANSAGE